MMMMNMFFVTFLCACTMQLASGNDADQTAIDDRGYILFCPCMGRFGNQMDYFLGTLSFAKGLNRTLVLAPWVEYRLYQPKSIQVPFDEYFKVDAVAQYHPAITMESFMKNIAPTIWPPEKRISFCHQERPSHGEKPSDPCASKNGNPPGPFWDTYGIDFVGSELHGPLSYDLHNVEGEADRWRSQYPSNRWPVLAFAGSPAPYPVLEQNVGLQRYFQWSDAVRARAAAIKKRLPAGPFVGVHLRLGSDWVNACEHVRGAQGNMFSSAQCLGYRREHGALTHELCYPAWKTVVRQIRRAVKRVHAVAVYVATDAPDRVGELRRALGNAGFQVVTWQPDGSGRDSDPHAELALLARSNFFIGNCVSSFTAVAKRERDVLGLPSGFWGFPPEPERRSKNHDEL